MRRRSVQEQEWRREQLRDALAIYRVSCRARAHQRADDFRLDNPTPFAPFPYITLYLGDIHA